MLTRLSLVTLASLGLCTALLGQSTPVPKPQGALGGRLAPTAINEVWANDGGDKVTKDELRASADAAAVHNSHWNGTRVKFSAAGNETGSFNVVLEAAATRARDVEIELTPFIGPGGASIASVATTGNGVFDWTARPVELFFVRYLKIEGLSMLAYNPWYDERHVPERMRRPWTGQGVGSGTWQDRPDHDRLYPEIAVPLELVSTFDVPAGENQSIWVDVYVPKGATPGVYRSRLRVRVAGVLSQDIPVRLRVHDFDLPDAPTMKTMLAMGYQDVNLRYLGVSFPCTAGKLANSELVRDRHFQMAHRHRISIVDRDLGCSVWSADRPRPEWEARLDGSLFTAAEGYAGPGAGVGNGLYSIGLWGAWLWTGQGEAAMWQHTDAWETWFQTNSPGTARSLYLADESSNFPQLEQWAGWMNANPGPGSALPSMATIQMPFATAFVPSLDIVASARGMGTTATWQAAANAFQTDPEKEFWFYNGYRPFSGSFATEDDGTALRALAWHQYKLKLDRWFFWESTYYNNLGGGVGQTHLFDSAHTFGSVIGMDPSFGMTGLNYTNGDGVLFYPGTDKVYPEDSYGVKGPLASLRLKHWRRGLQDGDYLNLAAALDPSAVQALVNSMLPEALWEYGVSNPANPTYTLTNISWSNDPDQWESARRQLASIIEG